MTQRAVTAVTAMLMVACITTSARADEPVRTLSLHLQAASPAALPAGRATGFGLGATVDAGHLFAGARLGAVFADEHTKSWEVTQTELRARLLAGVQVVVGRGRWFATVGGGVTALAEWRDRHQSERLNDKDGTLHTTALAAYAAVDAEVGVALTVAGRFGVVVRGGPTVHFGTPTGAAIGWSSAVGIERQF